MNEFNKKRLELISKNIDNVIEKAVIESGKKLEPLKENIDKALEVVEKFIIDNSRIIYGGLAQNELIKIKSKKDAFYKDNNLEIPDYDIYSPEPIKDLIYLANTLYDMGFSVTHTHSVTASPGEILNVAVPILRIKGFL